MSDEEQITIFEAVGGQAFFDALVDRFYVEIEADELLRPLYPPDLTESRRNLAEFLGQYWGGPGVYSDRKGHPRLRMRHVNFAIGEEQRAAWVRAMTAALDGTEPPLHPELRRRFDDYFEMAARHMINT
ncbi:MAG: globin [Actinomycetota bacterium]